jgi:hypothetical protein
MPFTVSHVAAVLPAYRALSRVHLFSAAVIGSMVPDFGMLLPGFTTYRWQTHSLMALWTFCLPMGLAAYALTLLLIKPAVLEVVPDVAYARLRAAEQAYPSPAWDSPRAWLYAAVVILLAAVTHLVWDGFTHENARAVRMFPVLGAYGPELDGHSMHIYRWLQYGSSVLGLVAVAAALWLWLRHASALKAPQARQLRPRERRLWIALYFAAPLVAVGVSWWHVRASSTPVGARLESIAVAGMRTSIVSLLCVSALVLLRLALMRRTTRP